MKNILYIGQFKDACGYANAARGYLRVFDKYLDSEKYNLKIIPLNIEKENYASDLDKRLIDKYCLHPEQVHNFINNNKFICFVHFLPTINNIERPETAGSIKKILESKNCIKKINFISWETDSVPAPWKKIYDSKIYNEIVVSCKWNFETFSKQLPLKVNYIPLCVHDYFNLDKKTNIDKFTIFSMSQWNHRKGFDILLKAYYQEFFDQQDVELFIKTYRHETFKGISEVIEKNSIIEDIKQYKSSCYNYTQSPNCKILLKTGFCEVQEIKKFYETCDVFCLPTRGEGFGMTIAQAAMSGVPCIVPNLGGHIDFLDIDSNYFINSNLEPTNSLIADIYSPKEMNYVEPSLRSTRQQLRKAYNDWKSGSLKDKGNRSKIYTKKYLSEEKIFNKLMDIL